MLAFLRKSVTSWVGILILGLALGALVFTLFQPTGPGGTAAGGGQLLATVGKEQITEQDYTRLLDRAVARERETNPRITNPDFIAAGGGELVLQQLIASKALASYGDANGLIVSRRMIDGEIASIPAMQLNGKFDEGTYRRLLAEQRLSEAELRESIRSDLLRRQLLLPVSLGQIVPRGHAEPFAELLLEVRKGRILPVPSAAMADPGKPTDAQLKAFHAENARAYTIPERRGFRFAELDMKGLAEKARPGADAVRKYYDENPQEFGGLETRLVNQIILRDAEKARAFVAAVRGGTPFAAAAAKEGFSAEDIALGTRTQSGLADETTDTLAKAVFALQPGAVTDPVESRLGFHVAEVARVIPASPQAFETVSAAITKTLQDEALLDLVADTVASAEDRLTGGESLADVAKDLGIEIRESPPLTADGRQFDADYAVTAVAQPLLPAVFAADAAEGPQVSEIEGNRYVIFEVTDVLQPTLVPLDKIREDVALAWEIKARSDAARAEAERIAQALGKGEALDRLVAGRNLPAPQPLTVRRLELTQMAQRGQQVPPPVLQLLTTPKGQARVLPAPGGQGWFVVMVDSIEPGTLSEAPQLAEAVRQSMLRDTSDEMVETFVRAIEREAGVVRRPDQLKAVNRRLTGETIGETID